MRYALTRSLALAALTAALSTGSVFGQARPSPSSSPSAAPEPAPATAVQELGGAWRRTAAGPFGALEPPGGWTGTEVVVVDPEVRRRAAAYVPSLDRWRAVARPPWRVEAGSTTQWTGQELLFVEPRGAERRGLAAYDPVRNTWRSTAQAPFNEIDAAVWADGLLVVRSALGAMAAYDLATDTWAELPLPPMAQDAPEATVTLHSTGTEALALVTGETLAFSRLDADSLEWGKPSVAPLAAGSAAPLWIDDAFLFLTQPREGTEGDDMAALVDGRFDPASGTWTELENACGIDTGDATWTGALVLDITRQRGLDPVDGTCYELPVSPWPERSQALSTWTGSELVQLSGTTSNTSRPRRDGVAYDPLSDGAFGVALDQPARPVRVRVPSLGIDLAVIWDGRKVAGNSRGYPACDVAEYWSVFALPGAPGTTWINAHAQPGMFLPLLTTLDRDGPDALLGRKVQLQLRDGRLLTYRTYRVNPRATNATLGTRGLKKGEHRLVLQTSTGVGPAPKLLVAGRLVEATTTDEPRPEPRPRACG